MSDLAFVVHIIKHICRHVFLCVAQILYVCRDCVIEWLPFSRQHLLRLCTDMAPKMKGKLPRKEGQPPFAKAALGKAAAKAVASNKKTKKGQLTKKNLTMLGNPLTLAEKVNQICEAASSPEEAAVELKKQLSTLENSKIWGKHKTHLNHNPEDKKSFEGLQVKKEKGLASALWFVQSQASKFQCLQLSMSSANALQKVEAWCSQKQMEQKFDGDELQSHLNSGRVIWRDDPITAGIYQCKDVNDVSRTISVQKNKSLSQGQEYTPDQDEEDFFSDIFSKDRQLTKSSNSI